MVSNNGSKHMLNAAELLERYHDNGISSREATSLLGPILEQLVETEQSLLETRASLRGAQEEIDRLKKARNHGFKPEKERRKESIRRNGVTLEEELSLVAQMEQEAEKIEAERAAATAARLDTAHKIVIGETGVTGNLARSVAMG